MHTAEGLPAHVLPVSVLFPKGLYLAVQPLHGLSVVPRGGCRATKAVHQGDSGASDVMDRAAQRLSCELSARGGCPVQVGAGAGNAVKSMTGMIMPGNRKEEKAARKSGDHQDNKAAKDLDNEMKVDPERMKKAVS